MCKSVLILILLVSASFFIPGPLYSQASQPDANLPIHVAPRRMKLLINQKGGGGPIRKVEVRLGNQKYFTGPDGSIEIELPESASDISFVKAGFQFSSLPWDEIKNVSELEIYLYPVLGADDEIIVRGKRRPSISKKVISSDEAARVAPGGDPGQVTKLLPGVTTKPGRSEVAIRGSKPEDSAYYLDDIKVPFIYHAIGNLSVLPPSVIDDVEFSAGGFGPEYGNATGGIVVLRSKSEIPEKPKTKFVLNLPLYSSIYHERPLSENSGMLVGVRRSYLELILPRVLPKNSGISVIPYFRDYQGIYTYKTEDGHYKLSLLASADGLRATAPGSMSQDESGTGRFFVQTYFGAVALERVKKLDSGWTLTTTPQTVYTDNKFEVNDLKFRVQGQTLRVPVELVKRLSSDERLYVGVEGSVLPFTVTYYLPRIDREDPLFDFEEAPRVAGKEKGTAMEAGTWVARDFKLPNGGIITPGIRAFYFSSISRASADPRLQYRQDMGGGNVLKAAIGQYSQNPRNGEPAKKYGNPKLQFPKAMHYILGLETKWDDRWDTDFQVFYKDVRLVVRSDPVLNYNNKGRLQSYGFETFVRRSLTEKWFGWLSYTWSKTSERKDDESSWYPGANDQTHVVSLAGSYRFSSTWDVGGRLGWHTGDAYTSKVGNAVYNANLDKYQPRSDNPVNGARLPSYHELSLFSGHEILLDTWTATARWGVEYFWFQRQAYGARPNYDYSKEEYFKGVPPIPYIELRGEF
jgi:TonB-dependent Receptor Plug Domain